MASTKEEGKVQTLKNRAASIVARTGESYIWYPNKEHCWLLGQVVDEPKEGYITVESDRENPNAGERIDIQSKKCKDWDTTHHEGDGSDISKCNAMSEAPLLDILRRRFLVKKIYTYVSDIVVAVNPYKNYPELTTIPHPLKSFELGKDPHVWAIGDFAYKAMADTFAEVRNQSVIVSGESGAGKTYACKSVMQYLTKLSANQTSRLEKKSGRRSSLQSEGPSIEEKILACNPFLEAFGNAKTTRNDNSSRFGKYIKIQFHKARIFGGEMEDYLLEKARVVSQLDGDRNFHIFYFVIKGATAEERKTHYIEDCEKYRYLSHRYIRQSPDDEDDEQFEEVRSCLKTAEVDSDTQQQMWRTISGILRLGNTEFKKAQDKIAVKNPTSVEIAAKLLGIPANGDASLKEMLVKRIIPPIKKGEAEIIKPYSTKREATDVMDALAKAIYAKLFKFVVSKANATLKADGDHECESFIGILDIFGFEIFVSNSFEQLLINYANELLQKLFNDHVFKNEIKMYESEEVPVDDIDFPDNQPCVDLIDADYRRCKFSGILAILDDLTNRPASRGRKAPDDKDYGKLLQKTILIDSKKELKKRGKRAQKFFRMNKLSKFKGELFWVKHFAGEVKYKTVGFIKKNADKVLPHLTKMMQLSSNDFIADLFLTDWDTGKKSARPGSEQSSTKRRKRKSGGKTISTKFKSALSILGKTLGKTAPHYIRCVKPNDHKYNCDQGWKAFEGVKVKDQLLRAGVMETVKIRQCGYPVRSSYDDLWKKYESWKLYLYLPMAAQKAVTAASSTREKCTALLGGIEDLDKMWYPGKTKMFQKGRLQQVLQKWRRKMAASEMQDWFRYYECQHLLHDFHCSLVYIQTSWKNKLIARKYAKMLGFISSGQRAAHFIVARQKLVQMKRMRDAVVRTQLWWQKEQALKFWAAVVDAKSNEKTLQTLAVVRREAKVSVVYSNVFHKLRRRLREQRAARVMANCARIIFAKRIARRLRVRKQRFQKNMLAFVTGSFAEMWLRRSHNKFEAYRRKIAGRNIVDQYLQWRIRMWFKVMRLAAISIQRRFRIYRARLYWERCSKARRLINAALSLYASRRRFLLDRRKAKKIQSWWRATLFRLWFRTIRNRVLLIQNWWRFRRFVRRKAQWMEAMDIACRNAEIERAKLLVSFPPPFHILRSAPNLINVKDPLYERTLAHSAVKGGSVEILRVLLASGIDCELKDSLDQTPLHMSCALGDANYEMTQYLLNSVNDVSEALEQTTIYEETPLDKLRDCDAENKLTLRLLERKGAKRDLEAMTPRTMASDYTSVTGYTSDGLPTPIPRTPLVSFVNDDDEFDTREETARVQKRENRVKQKLEDDPVYALMMIDPDVADPISLSIRKGIEHRAALIIQRCVRSYLFAKRLKRRVELCVKNKILEQKVVLESIIDTQRMASSKRQEREAKEQNVSTLNWRATQMRRRLATWASSSATASSSSSRRDAPSKRQAGRKRRNVGSKSPRSRGHRGGRSAHAARSSSPSSRRVVEDSSANDADLDDRDDEEEEEDTADAAKKAALYTVHVPVQFNISETLPGVDDDNEVAKPEDVIDDDVVAPPGLGRSLENLDKISLNNRRVQLMLVYHLVSFLAAPFRHRGWYYVDNKSVRRGPFPSKAMHDWYVAGVLRPSLLVSFCCPSGPFHSIEDIFDLGEDPFSALVHSNPRAELKRQLQYLQISATPKGDASKSAGRTF